MNENNLIPTTQRSKSEVRAMQSNGGNNGGGGDGRNLASCGSIFSTTVGRLLSQ